MTNSFLEAEKIREKLTEKYLLSEINKKTHYVTGISSCRIKMADSNAGRSNSNDYCVRVYLDDKVIPPFDIPREIDGIIIYKIRSLKYSLLKDTEEIV
ncbi:MAG: hypothetical protein Q7S27_03855 [Nanoarchaeota archaeon]|nr:hypothetical protein [Nanoarchaeota archaeon]